MCKIICTSSFAFGSEGISGVLGARDIRLSRLPRDDLALSKLFAEFIAFALSCPADSCF
jgi:hypothetical protein